MEKQLSPLSRKMVKELCSRGFSSQFAELIGQELNTDFTAKMMLGYLRDAAPSTPEEIADEMLSILALRDRIQRKKSGDVFLDIGPDL